MVKKFDFGRINYNGTGHRYPVTVRMDEKRELYYKCMETGHKADAMRLYNDYIAMKGAKIQIENAEYRRIEETA